MNLKNLSTIAAGAAFIAQLHFIKAEAATINQVNPDELTVTGLTTFEDLAGGAPPGTNYDAIFDSNGANFAERFVGQTLSFDQGFDKLSGVPTDELTLQTGNPEPSLNLFANDETLNSNALAGIGLVGATENSPVGEGSLAILFNSDQSEFGFDLVGGDGGSATVDFFRRDGFLVDTIVLDGLNNTSYGFSRDGVKDIAGFSIYNLDDAGIGFDNLRNDVSGVANLPPVSEVLPILTDPTFVPNASGVAIDPTPVPFKFSPALGILVLGAWGAIAQLKSLVQKRKSSGSWFFNK